MNVRYWVDSEVLVVVFFLGSVMDIPFMVGMVYFLFLSIAGVFYPAHPKVRENGGQGLLGPKGTNRLNG
jgi:hypothetical protein